MQSIVSIVVGCFMILQSNLQGFVNIEHDDRHHPSPEFLLILSDMSFIKGILSYQIRSWVPMTRPIFQPWFLQLRLVFLALWYSCGSTMDPIPWLGRLGLKFFGARVPICRKGWNQVTPSMASILVNHPWEILTNYIIRGHAGMVLQRCWGPWGTQS